MGLLRAFLLTYPLPYLKTWLFSVLVCYTKWQWWMKWGRSSLKIPFLFWNLYVSVSIKIHYFHGMITHINRDKGKYCNKFSWWGEEISYPFIHSTIFPWNFDKPTTFRHLFYRRRDSRNKQQIDPELWVEALSRPPCLACLLCLEILWRRHINCPFPYTWGLGGVFENWLDKTVKLPNATWMADSGGSWSTHFRQVWALWTEISYWISLYVACWKWAHGKQLLRKS